MIVRAIVEKLETDDGLVQFVNAHVGKVYLVELESIRRQQQMVKVDEDEQAPMVHYKDIIFTIDGTWLPLCCLRLVP